MRYNLKILMIALSALCVTAFVTQLYLQDYYSPLKVIERSGSYIRQGPTNWDSGIPTPSVIYMSIANDDQLKSVVDAIAKLDRPHGFRIHMQCGPKESKNLADLTKC